MEQTFGRVKAMPLDDISPYYTLKPRQTHAIRAKNQVLQVISGVAWVSNKGEDFVLKVGDAITLTPGGDSVAVVSALLKKNVQYTLRD